MGEHRRHVDMLILSIGLKGIVRTSCNGCAVFRHDENGLESSLEVGSTDLGEANMEILVDDSHNLHDHVILLDHEFEAALHAFLLEGSQVVNYYQLVKVEENWTQLEVLVFACQCGLNLLT